MGGDPGQRLDRYLAEQEPEISRSYLQKLIREGCVLADGKPAKGRHEAQSWERRLRFRSRRRRSRRSCRRSCRWIFCTRIRTSF